MNPELQRAQDMLSAMQAQRDQALNALVLGQAELAALRRDLAAKDTQIADLQSVHAAANESLD